MQNASTPAPPALVRPSSIPSDIELLERTEHVRSRSNARIKRDDDDHQDKAQLPAELVVAEDKEVSRAILLHEVRYSCDPSEKKDPKLKKEAYFLYFRILLGFQWGWRGERSDVDMKSAV